MDTDRAAADLEAVEHEVVARAQDLARVALEQRHVLGARRGERVVRGDELVALLVVLEEREAGDPEEVPAAPFGMRPSFWPRCRRSPPSTAFDQLGAAELEEQVVAGLGADARR